MHLALLWGAASVSFALSVEEVPNPRAQNGWVTDLGDVLPSDAEARINERIDALHRDLDVEIALVTVDQVDGTPKQFATALFNHWGIGDAQTHNGLLVLMVMGERRLEMETGYGLEPVLPDGWLGSMQQREMVPRFKRGDMAGGLERGLRIVDERLRYSEQGGGVPPSVGDETYAPVVGAPGGGGGSTFWVLGLGAFGLAAGGGGFAWSQAARRRRRTCETCDQYMPKLDEVADDAYLSAGEVREEELGSVNYDVHVCPTCDEVRTFPNVRWFTGFSECPSCRYHTRRTRSHVLVSPTQHSTGTRQVYEHCHYCDYHESYTRTIPRLPDTSSSSSSASWSSSSSGGSSFGGGSSGGGGAGSSW